MPLVLRPQAIQNYAKERFFGDIWRHEAAVPTIEINESIPFKSEYHPLSIIMVADCDLLSDYGQGTILPKLQLTLMQLELY